MDVVTLGMAKADAKKKYLRPASIAAKWGREHRAPARLSTITPTITNGGSTTTLAGSTLVGYKDSRFLYLGADVDKTTSSLYGQAKNIAGGGTAALGLSVNFGFNGQVFEMRTANLPNIRLWINGAPTTADFFTVGASGFADQLVKFDLGTRGYYEIRIEIARDGYFGGIRALATDIITTPKAPSALRLMVVGDSFGAGQSATGPVTIWNTPGYIHKLGDLLQIEDLWSRSIGGTGYLAQGTSGTAPTFRGRLATDVTPYNPDVVVFQGSINDYNKATSDLTTEIQALHAATKAAMPNVKIIATSPLSSANPTANVVSIAAAEKAAWEALGVPYIDMLNADTGTGAIGTNRTVTDAVLNSTTTVTSATAAFVAGDIGRVVSATGIPAGTTIANVTNGTTIVLSAAATASATGVSLAITNQRLNGSADYNRSQDFTHPSYPAGFERIAAGLAAGIAPILKAAV
jgi:hypothetical protein